MQSLREQLVLARGPLGSGIRIAVLDTGIDSSHPDLAGRVDLAASASFAVRDDLVDRDGHGTHIAGIIGGSGAGSEGRYRGIAPECELIVFKVQGGRRGPEGNSLRAIEEAIDVGADIINFSHGFCPDDLHPPPWIWPKELGLLEEAFAIAEQRGVLCVVAAGNAGPLEGSICRPGGCETVLTVGVVDARNKLLEMSSRGPYRRTSTLRRNAPERFDRLTHTSALATRKPDVVAPGVIVGPRAAGCLYADPDSELEDPLYVSLQGTSQATAVVSGLSALLLQTARDRGVALGAHPARTIRRLLTRSAVGLSRHSPEPGEPATQPVPYSPDEIGAGLLMWPNIVGVLGDFASDEQFRQVILADEEIHLVP